MITNHIFESISNPKPTTGEYFWQILEWIIIQILDNFFETLIRHYEFELSYIDWLYHDSSTTLFESVNIIDLLQYYRTIMDLLIK